MHGQCPDDKKQFLGGAPHKISILIQVSNCTAKVIHPGGGLILANI
jgi:hypothetical protein